ncbi:MAG: hypothetical protein KGQ79_08655 [Proteobacteria bacterium]|nr:hypothetical protein [Pseudomonadota bacterium]MBU6425328.1 hypothetical protein [Rhodospirillales bacterium]
MVGRLSRSAILHIGSEKTGSTAIQSMLVSRRDALDRLGYWYASSPGVDTHSALAMYAAPEYADDLLEAFPGGAFNEQEFFHSLANEIAALPSHVRTVIFSSEHCQSRLITIEHVAKLHALLSPYFDTITVIVYLRRQDEMAASLYSTRLRGGEPVADILSSFDQSEFFWARYFNYEQLLDRYAHVFGKSFVKPRIYEPNALLQGNAVHDFLNICGLPFWLAEEAAMVNRAIPADGQTFLLALNVWHAASGYSPNHDRAKPVRDACALIAEERLQGRPMRPARDEAQHFYEIFRASNERVREAWFPDRSSLFLEDFSQYPASADDAIDTHKAALRAAFVIIEELVRERGDVENKLNAVKDTFHASMSWRVTAPLRAASQARRTCRTERFLCRARRYLDAFRRKVLRANPVSDDQVLKSPES